MGFFSNVSNKIQIVALQAVLQDKVATLGADIRSRKLRDELGAALTESMSAALLGVRRASAKGQLAIAETMLAHAGRYESRDIVRATATYLIAVFIAASARARLYPEHGAEFTIIRSYGEDLMNELAAFSYDYSVFQQLLADVDPEFAASMRRTDPDYKY